MLIDAPVVHRNMSTKARVVLAILIVTAGCGGEDLSTVEASLTTTFVPIADAEVRSNTSTPDGAGLNLSAYLPNAGVEARSYLTFDTSSIPNGSTITSAKLRVFVINGTPDGPTVRTANGSFVESTVIWNNQPGYGASVHGNLGAATTENAWYEIPLAVSSIGDGLVNLALVGESTDSIRIHSREAANPPQLVVTYTQSTGLTVTPTGDAEVRSDTNTPLGTGTYLSAYLPGAGIEARTYLSFDTSALPDGAQVTSAKLRLYVTNGTSNGPTVRFASSSFTESTITWANQPGYGAGVLGNLGPATQESAWYEIALDPAQIPDGPVHLTLVAEVNDSLRASSREGTADPELVLTYLLPTGLTVEPTVDAEVRSDTSTPMGSGLSLSAYTPNGGIEARSYLTFDASGIPDGTTVTSAKLRVYVINGSADGPTVRVANAGFTEATVTWANQPGYGATVLGNVGAALTESVWLDIPITASAVVDGLNHIALVGETNDSLRIDSREAANRPKLVLTYADTPPSCGDGTCNGTETCTTCAGDCGSCPPSCGDGTCDGAETCSSCVADCGSCPPSCGDGTCNGTETCSTCAADCGACGCTGSAPSYTVVSASGETRPSTSGGWYTENHFGNSTKVIRVTTDGASQHSYNYDGIFSVTRPDGKKNFMLLSSTGRKLYQIDTVTDAITPAGDPFGANTVNCDWQHANFSHTEPDLIYCISQSGRKLYSTVAGSGSFTQLMDFTPWIPSSEKIWQLAVDENDDAFTFHTREANNSDHKLRVFAWDRSTPSNVYQKSYELAEELDESHMDKNGKYVMITRAGRFEYWDFRNNTFAYANYGDTEKGGAGHAVCGSGFEYASDEWDTGWLRRDMSSPATPTNLVQLCRDNNTPCQVNWGLATHESINQADERYFIVETYSQACSNGMIDDDLDGLSDYGEDPGCASAIDNNETLSGEQLDVTLPWEDEIIAVATDGSWVKRLAHHHSVQVGEYWEQPRASISYDGMYIIFTSNYDNLGQDVYILRPQAICN